MALISGRWCKPLVEPNPACLYGTRPLPRLVAGILKGAVQRADSRHASAPLTAIFRPLLHFLQLERERDREGDDVRADLPVLDCDLLREVRRGRVLAPDCLERRSEGRCSRGMSALTTSLTNRLSSASRNLAMRSSSRRILLANWAVSRSPTSSARASSRE